MLPSSPFHTSQGKPVRLAVAGYAASLPRRVMLWLVSLLAASIGLSLVVSCVLLLAGAGWIVRESDQAESQRYDGPHAQRIVEMTTKFRERTAIFAPGLTVALVGLSGCGIAWGIAAYAGERTETRSASF